MPKVDVTKDLENKTLIIETVVDAPREKVWRAYADREWFEKWWGPEGWETTTKEFDFKVGGKLHYGMKCVDESQGEWFGQESWGLMEIEEMDEPNSFKAKDVFADTEGNVDTKMPMQWFVIELLDEAGKTRIVCRSISESVEQLEQLVKMGMIEGFTSQLNKLEALMAE